MITSLIAFAVSVIAVALVYASWRQQNRGWLAVAGWLLACVSAFVWSRARGAEFGISYAIIVFVCLVWVLVVANMGSAKVQAGKGALRPFFRMSRPATKTLVRHGLKFLLSVPAAGLLALMLSVAVVLYLPWGLLLKLAVAIFLYPVLWGGISAWVCAQEQLLKPVLATAGLFAASYLVLFL